MEATHVSEEHEADDARLRQFDLRSRRDHARLVVYGERRDVARLLVADVEVLGGGFEVHLPRSPAASLHRTHRGHAPTRVVDAEDGDAVDGAVRRVDEPSVWMHLDVR